MGQPDYSTMRGKDADKIASDIQMLREHYRLTFDQALLLWIAASPIGGDWPPITGS